jgi:hypothetical protein
MFTRSFLFKLVIAVGFWTLIYAARAQIHNPEAGAATYSTTTNITVIGSTETYFGEKGVLEARRDTYDGTIIQTEGFYTHATSGDYQDSESDPDSPVLVPPTGGWTGDRVYIVAKVGTQSDGTTYVWIE